MRKRVLAALLLAATVLGAAFVLYLRTAPEAQPVPAPVEREISVVLPQGVDVTLELDGDLFLRDPLTDRPDPDGGKGFQQGYQALIPGTYKVHVKGSPTQAARSFWVHVKDAQSADRSIRGEIPAATGYGTLEVVVE